MKRENVVSRFRRWLGEHVEHVFLVVIVAATLCLLALLVFGGWGIYSGSTKDGSRLYLLSSVVQGLAAVLAVLVTLSLFNRQQAAASTPQGIRYRLTDFWLWSATGIYLAAIGWSLVVLGGLGSWIPAQGGGDRISVNVALVLALAALLYVVPFTMANLRAQGAPTLSTAARMIKRDDYDALDELLRMVINQGTMTLVIPTLKMYVESVKARLDRTNGAVADAQETVQLFRQIGRHACQRHSPDAVAAVMRQLTALTAYCSHVRRQWRAAADVFNEAVKELYSYSEEWIGRPQP